MKVESVILSFIYTILYKIQDAYYKSCTHGIISSFATKGKQFLAHSRVWQFIWRKGRIAEAWEKSFTIKSLSALLNFPSRLLRKAYIKYENILSASLVMKGLKLALNQYTLVLGGCLGIIIVIPDKYWYNKYSLIITLLLAMLFLSKTIIQDNQKIHIKSLELPLFIFWGSVAIATINSALPGTSLNYFILYAIAFVFMVLIVSSISSYKELNLLVEILLLSVAFTALYGIYQWKVIGIPVNPSITDTRLSPGLSRIASTMGNENVYGELLVLIIPFFAAIIINAKTFLKKAFFSALFIPTLLALFLTGSRSAWISFAVSVFIFIFLKDRRFIPLALLVGILSIPILPAPIYNRIMTLFNPNDNSSKYRTLIFEHARPMLKDYWVTGVGLGSDTFISIFKRYLSFKLPTAAHTHNIYLQLWLEAGIGAILSFIWFLFRLFKNSAIKTFQKGKNHTKNILIAGISALSGILVMGMADHIWFYNRLMLMFWIIVGIVLACLNILNNEGELSEGGYSQTNESNRYNLH